MGIWTRAARADKLLFMASVCLLALSATMVSVHDRQAQAAPEDEEFYRFVDLAAEIYNEIETKYVDEVDSKKVLEAGLAGMFRALDEHSQYLSPDMLADLEKDTSGEFSGIGIHITMRQGILTVIAPIPGTPAAEAGIQPWDRIIEIEGETTEGMTTNDAVKKLTGPSGTEVTFKIFRQGEPEPLEFTLRRANVEIESVYSKMFDEGIGYVRLTRFSDNTSRDLKRALVDLRAEGLKGLILDLRYNSGGLLREAIDVSDLFVDKGEMVVSTKGRIRSQNREYRAVNDPMIDVPIFVLVNSGTASASEIVAGAIQDHRLGVIMGPAGKNTFGKGSVQTIGNLVNSLEDDENGNPRTSAVRLTTAKYYTPSGRTIHHIGITPDIGVPMTDEQEIELLRHGMIGDVTTGEDYKLRTPDEAGADESPEVKGPEPSADPEDSDKPFYDVSKPTLLEKDDFVDVMLEEALKQMKIYMILHKEKGPMVVPEVAAAPAKSDVTATP